MTNITAEEDITSTCLFLITHLNKYSNSNSSISAMIFDSSLKYRSDARAMCVNARLRLEE